VPLLEHEVEDIAGMARYADAIGVAKSLATPEKVAAAHEAGIAVHVWTFRAENEFLPDDLKSGTDPAAHGDLPAEIERYLARGIDGFFVDFPAIGVRVRNRFVTAGAQPTFPPPNPSTSR
jgi:glycerophosphoryl diester phosphodiesterase